MSKVHASNLGRWADRLVWFVSGEWILTWTPYTANGGTVVTARSVWVSGIAYLAALLLKTRFSDGRVAVWDLRQGAADVVETLPWFAAILGGVYAALYSRFSSQWNYLANLFNQIVQAQLSMPTDDLARRKAALSAWKAAFIEDAQDLHLATKPMFLMAVLQWGADPYVAAKFASNTVGGAERLTALLQRLRAIRGEDGTPTEEEHPEAAIAATGVAQVSAHG